ncbi:hybrid signal transduction histidine kinase L [Geobacter sp. OR-1]|uniref:response regulator n=1 Tax=Geobacter sp. OR-1 TaxID=1266765 RepID=UPI000542B6F6|nr:response regulator [Geobacter sp. OR-1]GAM09018.1 hybrid signal transduction histidine kinase L [Geobacter sp. OR-1]
MDLHKCLIVDDEELARETLSLLLTGVECEMAKDGNEAVAKFEKSLDDGNRFDLVFLDIVMPELNGHETGKALRKREKDRNIPVGERTKIVMLTALNSPNDVMESMMSSQSSAYLVKPVEPQKLRETLSKIGLKIPK